MALPARWLVVAVLLTGCVTGQASPPRAPHVAQAEAECEVFVARADSRVVVDTALYHGALSSLYHMVRGAAVGAIWGAFSRAGGSDGAWIGAAAGAGLGAMVGVVEGVERGLAERRYVRAAFEGCVASRLSAREPDDHD